ncbi:UNVERIFIED_CONTAM: hypothetical protein FKN15_032940 [Acipenser sinensis]
MITAGHLFLSVLSSLLVLAAGLELLSQDNVCSTVVAGVLYGSFSLKDVFPKIAAGCSWTLENPDPTKYSLYFKFNREENACLHFSPMVLPLDHYLSNHTCTQLDYIDYEGVELCESRAPVTFLQFDKNFVQLCLTREPEDVPFLAEETLEFHLVEVLLINNENSSQFTCGILCRWFEECLRSNRKSEHCGITQTGCICPEVLPAPPSLSATRQNESVSNVILPPPSSDCCVTELHSTNANNIAPRDARQALCFPLHALNNIARQRLHKDHDVDEEQKVKTQRPRSADQPGTFQAQTGDPAAEEWSQWSVCSLTCGQGWQVRTRSCVSSPYGTLCSGPLRETRLCNNTATCPDHDVDEEQKVKTQRPRSADQPGTFQAQTGDPAGEEWSQWSVCSLTCGQGWQVRTRSCVSSPYGTLCSGPLRETRLCNNTATCPDHDVDEEQKVKTQRPRSADQPGTFQAQTGDPAAEEWSQWSVCSLTCGQGWQVRTRSCVSSPYGTLCSGPLRETRLCNNTATCPVEGQWLEWTPWTRCSVTCSNGTQQRTRRCSASVHGWTECKGPHADTRNCVLTACPADGKWGNWNHWSLCSKTCDTGWQQRFRMCQGTGEQGYPCEGSGEEVRTCNDKKCPAPHEMCRDEYVVSMTWKRAAAGEIVYNKCPSNATAKILLTPSESKANHPSVTRVCLPVPPPQLREHLAKGQRTLAGEGMSQVVRSLLELMSRKSYYSGDLLFSVEILRNVTDTFKRATYIPAADDIQRFFQVVSLMLDVANREKWDDAQQFNAGTQSSSLSTVISIQREPVTAVSSDIHFPTKGRRGMKDWARSSEDKLFIPKEVFTLASSGGQGGCRNPFLSATLTEQYASLCAPGTSDPHCVIWDYSKTYIKSERSIILLNFCLSILASNILILVGQSQTLSRGVCTMTAAFLHFFFLSSFCWVLTEAWQSYLAVIGKIRTRLIRKRFLCLGWGLPALIVAVSVGFTRARGYGTARYCWLSLEGGLLYAFVGPAAVIVLVNMLIGIVVFNKLMSRDGISDKSKKQRAGASLWSSCVVLPLLALTWMSAVLAMTDRRSVLFQVLFAVFDSVQGFVIIAVHCALRREVQDAVKSRMGICKSEESENSPDSCKNGQAQIMTDFEKDVDLACQTVIFKEVNTCNPSTITGTLSRISLDDDEDPKLHTNTGGLHFSSLPGNIPPPNILVQVPQMTGLNELKEQTLKKDVNLDPRGPMYLCTDNHLRSMELNWARPQEASLEGDYMVLPRRTVSLKPFSKDEGKPLNIKMEHPTQPALAHRPAKKDMYPNFVSVDHINMNLNQSYGTLKHPHGLQFKQHPSVRQILASELGDKSRTMPRSKGSPSLTGGSLEVIIFKEVNTCNPSTITGTLSRISLDDDEDPKLHTNTEGLHFSSLPGNIPPPNILVQVKQMTGLNELKEQTLKKDMNLDPRGPVYLCTDNHLRSMELNWARPQEASSEGDYMVLPRRTVSLKPFSKDEGKPLNIKMEHPTQPALAHRPAEKDMYPNFVSVDHINMNLNQSYGTLKHPHGLQFKQHPSVRQILASELGDKSRTMPRSKGSPNLTGGSLERKRVRYSDLDFEKVMHTRKRHSELYHELNQKFHTIDRCREPSTATFKVGC